MNIVRVLDQAQHKTWQRNQKWAGPAWCLPQRGVAWQFSLPPVAGSVDELDNLCWPSESVAAMYMVAKRWWCSNIRLQLLGLTPAVQTVDNRWFAFIAGACPGIPDSFDNGWFAIAGACPGSTNSFDDRWFAIIAGACPGSPNSSVWELASQYCFARSHFSPSRSVMYQ